MKAIVVMMMIMGLFLGQQATAGLDMDKRCYSHCYIECLREKEEAEKTPDFIGKMFYCAKKCFNECRYSGGGGGQGGEGGGRGNVGSGWGEGGGRGEDRSN